MSANYDFKCATFQIDCDERRQHGKLKNATVKHIFFKLVASDK